MPGDLVELALWMAAEYCSTPARALTLVLAAARARRATALYAQSRRSRPLDGERLTDGQRALLERAAGPGRERPGGAAAPGEARPGGDRRARAPARAAARTPRARPRAAALTAGSRRRPSRRCERGGEHLAARRHRLGQDRGLPARRRARRSSAGEGVIVLVPEIALTPQTVARFQARFGDTVAVLHSALGEGERYDEWRAPAHAARRGSSSGRARRCSRRSRDLGLVVIDEEHDASYKHEGDPRYDARRVASERARRAGARAARRQRHAAAGDLARARAPALPQRVDGRPLPPVARARHARRARTRCTPSTRRCARATARKSIVLLNRRGWSNFLTCRELRQGLGLPALRRRARAAPRRGRRWPATTAATASRCRRAATPAARSRSPATAPAPSGSSTSWREALDVPVFRLDADTAAAKDAVPSLLARFERRARRACCSARRWSPRATTSPTSRSASCSTPTRPCASRTSAPRSGRSRSSPSSPAAPAAARRGGRGARADAAPDARVDRRAPRATTPRASWPASSSAARRCATRRSPTSIRVVCSRRGRARRRAAAAAVRDARRGPGRRRARPGAAVPAARSRALPGRGQGRATGPRRSRAVGAAVRPRRRQASTARSPSPSTSTRSEPRRPGRSSGGGADRLDDATCRRSRTEPPSAEGRGPHARARPRGRVHAARRRCAHVRKYGDPVLQEPRARRRALRRRPARRGRGAWAG